MLFKCRLPFPPSVNGMYGGGSNQKRFPSKKYKDWLLSCQKLEPKHIDHPVHMVYVFTFPDKRTRDMSNFIKAIDDYLVKNDVLTDDNWNIISRVTIAHDGVDKANSGVSVSIFPLDNQPLRMV